MVKSLVRALAAALIPITVGITTGCKKFVDFIVAPEKTTVSVEPPAGDAPLTARIQVPEPENFAWSISDYELFIDREGTANDKTITSDKPIDTIEIFDKTAIVTGTRKDVFGRIESGSETIQIFEPVIPEEPPIEPPTPTPSISQSVERINYVDIKYDATISHLERALLKVYLAGNSLPFITKEIKTANYSETFSEMSPGNYEFVLESPEEGLSDVDDVDIPNLVLVSGKVEDCEKDENTDYNGKKLFVELVDASNNASLGSTTEIGSGVFSIKANAPAFEVLVKSRLLDASGNPISYIRTIKLDGAQDYSDKLMRVVPYTGLEDNEITPEQFKKHMEEVNMSPIKIWENVSGSFVLREIGLRKYNIHNIKLVKYNGEKGSFSDPDLTHYKNLLIANDITNYTEGRILASNIVIDSSENPDLNLYQDWIVVKRDTTIKDSSGNPVAGEVYGFGGTEVSGIVTGGLEVRINILDDNVFLHELDGHTLSAPYDPPNLPAIGGNKTITDDDFDPKEVVFTDWKRKFIVYDPTINERETSKYVLGL